MTIQPFFRRTMKSFLFLALVAISIPAAHAQATAPHPAHPRPKQPNPQVLAAIQLEQQGRNAEAEQAWRAISKAAPSNPEPYAHLGLLAARENRFDEAIALYGKALKIDPTTPGLRTNLALAEFKAGKLKEAAADFAIVVKQPNLPPAEQQRARILLGMAHYGLGEYKAAIEPLREAAKLDPSNLPMRLSLAQSCLWTRQLDCVLDTYKEILLINPDSAEADMLAGEALDEKGDNAGAVAQFQAAVKADPKLPNVHFGLAYLLWAQKRYEEAIPEFGAELANDSTHAQSLLYLGDTYVQLEQYDKARESLEHSLKLSDKEPLVHLDLGIVYQETGDRDAAVAELMKTIELAPDEVNAHFRLARLYQAMGRKDEAKAEFAKASSLNKKADKALYERISEANAKPSQTPAATPTPQQH